MGFLFLGIFIGVFIMCLLQNNKKDCLHCEGTGSACYCEKCYQELVAKNLQLQTDYMRLERKQAQMKSAINKVIVSKDKYINDLQYIRDCYYKEIAEREEIKKIFRLDKPLYIPVSEKEKMEVIINHIPKID